jgi:hypothetical protein
MPLERAQMRVRVVLSGKEARKLRDKLAKLTTTIESENWDNGELNLVCPSTDNIQWKILNNNKSSSQRCSFWVILMFIYKFK